MKNYLMQNKIPFYNFFNLYRFSKDQMIKPNWHDEIEILFMLHGESVFLVDGKEVVLKEKDIYIINPQIPHSHSNPQDGIATSLIIANDFIVSNGFGMPTGSFIEKNNDEELWNLFKKFYSEYYSKENFREVSIRISILQILKHIFENYYVPNKLFGSNKKINDILKFLNENYAERITLDDLAQKFKYNKCHLTTTFKKETGYTVVGYINAMRCNYADSLLKDPTLSIKDISSICGFNSVSNFNKTYKNLRGKCPTEQRNAFNKFLKFGKGLGQPFRFDE